MQGTAFEEHRGANPRPILERVSLEVENKTCCHRALHRSHTNEKAETLQLSEQNGWPVHAGRECSEGKWPPLACLQGLDGDVPKCRRVVVPGEPKMTLGQVFARMRGVVHETLNGGQIAI